MKITVIALFLIIIAGRSNVTPVYSSTYRPHLTISSTTATYRSTCSAPLPPVNGTWEFDRSQCSLDLERCIVTHIKNFHIGTHLSVRCFHGFRLNGPANLICSEDGTWTGNIPVCEEIRCKNLNSASRAADCIHPGPGFVTCESPRPGTIATLKCRNSYRKDRTLPLSTRVTCSDTGNWVPQPLQCVPVCGVIPASTTPLIVNGTAINIAKFPWHATLYEAATPNAPKEFTCGGTIIQERLIITAAHCVYDDNARRENSPSKYFVATGNIYRDYDSPYHNPAMVMKTAVKNIYVHGAYNGIYGSYKDAIAILEVTEPFVFSTLLHPICLDYSNDIILEPDFPGRVAGFGRTALGASSYILQTITVQYISSRKCKEASIIHNTENAITHDKFCAGYTNGSSVCDGYSGGGLIFRWDSLWYLKGIASASLATKVVGGATRCDSSTYSLYTRVSDYMPWIENYMLQSLQPEINEELVPGVDRSSVTAYYTSTYRPPLTSSTSVTYRLTCTPPPQPQNGFWELKRTQCPFPEEDCHVGQEFPPGTHLVYSCNSGFKISGSAHVFCGVDGKWSEGIPVCEEIRCKDLNSASIQADCQYHGSDYMTCNSPRTGTTATLQCRNSYYADITLPLSTRVTCNDIGQWVPEPLRCIPVCGFVTIRTTPLVVNGTAANIAQFPWHATLYRAANPNAKKEFICGGSIIQERLLITAAHCVYDETNNRKDEPSKYFVATGNVYRDYDSPLHDSAFVQKTAVKYIYVHLDYFGIYGSYSADIAIVEVTVPFVFSALRQPICMDYYNNIDLGTEMFGRVTGFGRTALGGSSYLLQTIEVPYVNQTKCREASNTYETQNYVTYDKFCAGYTNGSAVCEGDSGGGLVFKQNSLWYLKGIVSASLGTMVVNGTRQCDSSTYSLYTKVSIHMTWIKCHINLQETSQQFQECRNYVR